VRYGSGEARGHAGVVERARLHRWHDDWRRGGGMVGASLTSRGRTQCGFMSCLVVQGEWGNRRWPARSEYMVQTRAEAREESIGAARHDATAGRGTPDSGVPTPAGP
jgi:hypothetical protein